MGLKPITIDLHTTLSEAAILFIENKIESLPVMENGNQLVGMITRSDLGRAFLAMTSYMRRGIQVGIRMADRPGEMLDLIAIIRNAEARIASIISTDDPAHQTRDIHLHIYDMDRDKLPNLMGDFRNKGSLLYMVDLTNNERFIYAAEE
jgi:acetoin utilization protein AcuB